MRLTAEKEWITYLLTCLLI